jgi:predicted Zn-ribbon and HTH transcriptional regulator
MIITLTEINNSKLDNETLEFGPIECMNCGFDGPIPIKYYLVEPEITNEHEYKQLKTSVKKQLGHDSFCETGCEFGDLISVCRCPKCGSEEIFQDL